MSAAAAGFWATIPTLVGIAGSLTIPRLATPERRYWMLGGLFCSALAGSLLLRADQGLLLMIGLTLQGIARSSMMTVAMLTLVETPGIGERRAATASGMFFTAAEVGGASGPLIMGAIHDASDGFGACLWFLTSIAAGLILISLRLRSIAASRDKLPAPGA
jgi:cyanate permease